MYNIPNYYLVMDINQVTNMRWGQFMAHKSILIVGLLGLACRNPSVTRRRLMAWLSPAR